MGSCLIMFIVLLLIILAGCGLWWVGLAEPGEHSFLGSEHLRGDFSRSTFSYSRLVSGTALGWTWRVAAAAAAWSSLPPTLARLSSTVLAASWGVGHCEDLKLRWSVFLSGQVMSNLMSGLDQLFFNSVTVGISFGIETWITFSYLCTVHLEPLLVWCPRLDGLRFGLRDAKFHVHNYSLNFPLPYFHFHKHVQFI